jgi:hypothetical protein
MKKGYLFATLGLVVSIVMAAVGIFVTNASAATGCTCPTGCATRVVQNAPYSVSGAGEYCFESTDLGAYVQSWGADIVNITGVDYTNMYMVTDQMLRDTTGKYFVYYKAGATGNFGTNGTSTVTNCTKAWCSNAQYGQMNMGEFTMYNNAWGAANGQGQYTQANSSSDWSSFGTYPETGGVKSYPNASLEMSGKTISTLGTCTSSFNVTVPSTGSYESAYDIWVPSEIMLWMNKNGAVGPIAQGWNDDGTPIPAATNVTVGGHTWDVYHGGSNVVSFVRQGNINSGTVDILAILNWTAAQGWISNTSNLGKFQWGFEITSAPGGLNFVNNSYSINCGGRGGGIVNTPVPTVPTRTLTPGGPVNTPTRTNTPPAITNTPTRTLTPSGPATLTRTPTIGPSATRTSTSTVGPSATTGSGTCSPVTSTITIPFTFDGAGTFCWQGTSLGSFINSWNTTSVSVNGVNVTNIWVGSGSYPAKINGFYYVSYSSSVAFGHFEAKP